MRPTEDTVALVTGATDGLGRSVATELARAGASVIVHGRDRERGEATLAAIRAETGSDRLELELADFASLAEVRRLADAVEGSHDELHLLINNAGIGGGLPAGRERQQSTDGHELRFAVNYLAGFVLTERLLGLLRRSAPARVVNVASLGQMPIDFADPMLRGGYDGTRAYCQSKLAQVMHANDIADRIPASELTAYRLHPATYLPTKIVLEEIGRSSDPIELGTRAVIRLATDPALDGVSGRFFDRLEESAAESQAYDPEARSRLRELSLELAGD